MFSKDFEKAMEVCMLSEVGPWFKKDHPACKSGIKKTKSDRLATGYVNDQNDRGGKTAFGIAQTANPTVNIDTLTYEQAEQIYYKKYWDLGECDQMPYLLNIIHFDAVVNHGTTNSGKFIQRALGFLGTAVDGDIGPQTIKTIMSKSKSLADIKTLCLQSLDQRERFFKAIVANNPSQLKFLNGWLNRVNMLRKVVSQYK